MNKDEGKLQIKGEVSAGSTEPLNQRMVRPRGLIINANCTAVCATYLVIKCMGREKKPCPLVTPLNAVASAGHTTD